MLESPEYKSVIYLEGENSGLFLEKPEEVAAYRSVLEHLAAAALSEGESRDLIAAVAIDLYGEDRHGVAEEFVQQR